MAISTIPLTEFIGHYLPTYSDLSLADSLAELYNDPLERLVIDDLVIALRRDGRFYRPILVDSDQRIVNGNHRAAAHLVAGSDSVDITDQYADQDDARLVWAITTQVSGGLPINDEQLDRLISVLRSFPMADTWCESDCCSGSLTEGIFSGIWVADKASLPLVCETLIRRAAQIDVSIEVTECLGWDPIAEDFVVKVGGPGSVADLGR